MPVQRRCERLVAAFRMQFKSDGGHNGFRRYGGMQHVDLDAGCGKCLLEGRARHIQGVLRDVLYVYRGVDEMHDLS